MSDRAPISILKTMRIAVVAWVFVYVEAEVKTQRLSLAGEKQACGQSVCDS